MAKSRMEWLQAVHAHSVDVLLCCRYGEPLGYIGEKGRTTGFWYIKDRIRFITRNAQHNSLGSERWVPRFVIIEPATESAIWPSHKGFGNSACS